MGLSGVTRLEILNYDLIMISIEVDSVSHDGLRDDLKKYGIEAKKAIDKAVKSTSLFIAKTAKQRLHGMLGSAKHYITGRLATSIHPQYKSGESFSYTAPGTNENFDGTLGEEVGELEAIVGTNVEYAPKIEFEKDQFLGYAGLQGEKYLEDRVIIELNKLQK